MTFLNLEERTKLNLVYLYGLLRTNIFKTEKIGNTCIYKAHINEDKLAKQTGVSERTIRSYIKVLKDNGYINDIRKVPIQNSYYYNEYEFPELKEYGVVLPELLYKSDITSSDKGLLILLKLNCQVCTNVIEYTSNSALAKSLGITRQTLTKKLNDLAEKKYVIFREGWLYLPQIYFPLYVIENGYNLTYKAIYDYCIVNNCVPPFKRQSKLYKSDSDLYAIYKDCEKYAADNNLDFGYKLIVDRLKDKFPNLPDKINFGYLKTGLIPEVRKSDYAKTKEFVEQNKDNLIIL